MPHKLQLLVFNCIFVLLVFSGSIQAQTDISDVTKPSSTTIQASSNQNVNLSTGTVSPSIHLMDLAGKGNLHASVDLVYTAGQGLKVENTGRLDMFGWDIVAGGTISRQVRGLPDEKKHAWNDRSHGWLDTVNIGSLHYLIHNRVNDEWGWDLRPYNDDYYGFYFQNGDAYYDFLDSDHDLSQWCLNHRSDVDSFICKVPNDNFMIGALVNYFHQETPPDNYECFNCWWLALADYFSYAQQGNQYPQKYFDSEPDIFNFSFDGYSGQFVFDETGVPHLIPQQDIKIEPAIGPHSTTFDDESAWIFTTPEGNRYIFKNTRAYTAEVLSPYTINPSDPHSSYISTWYLTKIMDADNNAISFTYADNYTHGYRIGTSQTEVNWIDGPTIEKFGGDCHGDIYKDDAGILFQTKDIVTIKSDYGTIYNPSLGSWYYELQQKDNNDQIIKRLKFYAQNSFTPNQNEDTRYRLDSLVEIFTGGKTRKYSFDYKPMTTNDMTSRKLDADRWGFYNKNNRTSDNYRSFDNAYSGCADEGWDNSLIIQTAALTDGAKRDADPESAQEGILTKITYPSGAETNYEYEGNSYSDGVSNYPWGGLRIKKITQKSAADDSNPIITNYSYQLPSELSSGAVEPLRRQYDISTYYDSYTPSKYCMRYSNPNRAGALDFIRYSRVEVSTHGTGKTVYEYTNFNDHGDIHDIERKKFAFSLNGISSITPYYSDKDNDAGAPFDDRSYERGLLKKTTFFREDNSGNYFKVKEIENTYDFNISPGTSAEVTGVKINSELKFYYDLPWFHFLSYAPSACNVEYYHMTSRWISLVKSKTTTYSIQSDGTVSYSNPMISEESYSYSNPSHMQLQQTESINSDGTHYSTSYLYPKDYTTTTSSDAEVNAIQTLQDKHIDNAMIEQINYIKRPGDEDYKVIGASLFKYGLYGDRPVQLNSPIHYPQQSWQLETDEPLSDFTSSNISADAFHYDSRYALKILACYDNHGQANSSANPFGLINSTQYSSWSGLQVAKYSLASYNPTAIGNECSFLGFEEKTTSNSLAAQSNDDSWIYAGSNNRTSNPKPHTGQYCNVLYTSAGSLIEKTFLPDGQNRKYKFSAWVFGSMQYAHLNMQILHDDGSPVISGSDVVGLFSTVLQGGTAGRWNYYEVSGDLNDFRSQYSSLLSNNEQLKIKCFITVTQNDSYHYSIGVDDICFTPYDANFSTFSYNKKYLLIGTTTNNLKSLTYEYDDYNNPKYIRDEDGKITSANFTHYKSSSSDHNYVQTVVPKIPVSSVNVSTLNPYDNNYTIAYSYTDGLGRSDQTITLDADGDQIAFHKYDDAGRELTSYLPYTANATNGSYQSDPESAHADFYEENSSTIHATSAYPFSKVISDNSPLNRVLEAGAVGSDWQPGNNHTIKNNYKTYDGNWLPVWRANETAPPGALITSYYDAYSCNHNTSTDENGHASDVFTDKAGRLICKRTAVMTDDYDNNLTQDYTHGTGTIDYDEFPEVFSRYYYVYNVYDDFGRVVYEIPAAASLWMEKNSTSSFTEESTDPLFDKYIIAYHYDKRGRMVEKHSPGAGWSYTIYNKMDQPILTQTENQRINNDWSFVKYDIWGRMIMNGIIHLIADHTITREEVQGLYNTNFENVSDWECRTEDSGNVKGYTNTACPGIYSNSQVYNISYYDDYNFDLQGQNYVNYGLNAVSNLTKGKLTGSITKVLDGSVDNYLLTVNYYDKKGRGIQQHRQNHIDGWDIIDNQFSYTSKLLKTVRLHYAFGSSTPITIANRFEYDHTGKLINEYHKIGNSTQELLLAHYEYNELGQRMRKDLDYKSSDESYLQQVDYRYNIRGWLTSINNVSLIADGVKNLDNNDVFGEELSYNNVSSISVDNTQDDWFTTAQQFNGNVSSMKWKSRAGNISASSKPEQLYAYRYDDLNRMTAAWYAEGSSGYYDQAFHTYDERLAYDINGNIAKLRRNNVQGAIDDISYEYDGNKLLSVSDNISANYSNGFTDRNTAGDDYGYDANGNITSDLNKNLSQIVYNYFNMPTVVSDGTHNLEYLYDGRGMKLKKTDPDGNVHDYVGGIEYENGSMQFIGTSQGRARPSDISNLCNTVFHYDYFLKDHVGNVHAIITRPENISSYDYLATMETAACTDEETLFEHIADSRANAPSALSAETYYTDPNEKASLLNAADNIKGPAKALSVRQGDKINIDVKYYYNELPPDNSSPSLSDILTQLANTFILNDHSIAGPSNEVQQQWADATFNNNAQLSTFMDDALNNNSESTAPHAYLTYITFDNNFNFIAEASGVMRVETENSAAHLAIQDLVIPVNGYTYIYVSNQSSSNVYFDDLRIQHTPSNVLELNDYYPYGMLYDNHSATTSNKYKYQTNELETALDYNMEEFDVRHYDAVLGRWNMQDPASQFSNPYLAMADNPVAIVDPNGSLASGSIHSSGWGTNSGITTALMNGHLSIIFDHPYVPDAGTMAMCLMEMYTGHSHSGRESEDADFAGDMATLMSHSKQTFNDLNHAETKYLISQLQNGNMSLLEFQMAVHEAQDNQELMGAYGNVVDGINAGMQVMLLFAGMGDLLSAPPQNNGCDPTLTAGLNGSGNSQNSHQVFPSISTIKANYPPDDSQTGRHWHDPSFNYPNQCAVRLGKALMDSGVDFSEYSKWGPQTSNGYPTGAKSLADFLWNQFGAPDAIISNEEFDKNDYQQSSGIFFEPGGSTHIDYFDHGDSGSGYYSSWDTQVWVWFIPSKI
jgi:RHS repeat-associated protein